MTTFDRTSFVEAKARLVANLTSIAAEFDPKVVVAYGYPNDATADDYICVLSAVNGTQTVRRGRKREESYSIPIICSTYRGGPSSQQVVTERAVGLAVLVEIALENDRQLGGCVDAAFVDGPFQVNEARPASLKRAGRVTEVTLSVRCENREYDA